MRSFIIIPFLTSIAVAAPARLVSRQSVSDTETELENGPCRPITFIFARGSTELGNLGDSVGPPTCSGLKNTYGDANIACQGVGGPYIADLASNALPEGTSPAAIAEAERLFELANTKCPDTIVVAGGYSQGAAVMVGSVRDLSATVQGQIAGVVLYGNTRNAQEGGKIPNFPPEKVLTICNVGDDVCYGTLIVTAAHLAYAMDVPQAVSFLEDRIAAAGGI